MNRRRVVSLAFVVILASTAGLLQYERMETDCNNSLELTQPVGTFVVQQSDDGWLVRHDGGDEIPRDSTTNVTVNITYADGSQMTFLWSELEGGTYPITEGDTARLANSSLSGRLENASVQVVWFGVNTATPEYCNQWPLFENRRQIQQPMPTTVEDS